MKYPFKEVVNITNGKNQNKDLDILTPPIDIQTQFATFVRQIDKSKFFAI